MYGQGISREGEIIDMGVEHGFIEKSGAWYSYQGDRIGQGKDNSREYLRENPASPEKSRTRFAKDRHHHWRAVSKDEGSPDDE